MALNITRYQAVVEYDGTAFAGFQRQATERTVQGEIENGLRKIGWDGDTIYGAGRTDAGVHATGQVIAFDMAWAHGTGDLWRALNTNLPLDVAVKSILPCAQDFHPRYHARARRYRYTINNVQVRSPMNARYAWHVWPPVLNLSAMQAAAEAIVGRQDFATFGTDPDNGNNTVRNVLRAEWSAPLSTGILYFDIQADAFLYHMVRSLVGALKHVGSGELSAGDFDDLLKSRNRSHCPPLAPPHGLCLTDVLYH